MIINIYYATKTSFTKNLAMEFKKFCQSSQLFNEYGVGCGIYSLSQVKDKKQNQNTILVFFLPTYTDDIVPISNILNFFQQQNQQKIAIFSIGDSNYSQTFHKFGRAIKSQLQELRMKQILQMGEIDRKMDENKEKLQLLTWFQIFETNLINLKNQILISSQNKIWNENEQPVSFQQQQFYMEFQSRKNIRKTTIELKFRINDNINYASGENILLFPENSDEDVSKLKQILNSQNSQHLKSCVLDIPIYIDELQQLPLDSFNSQKWILNNMEDKTFTLKELINMEIIQFLNQENYLYNAFWQSIPQISGRFYSICSTNLKQQNILKIMVSLKPNSEGKLGQSCAFLSSLKQNDKVQFTLQKTQFQIENIKQQDNTVIFLALGVGISPFLSILEEQYLKGNPQRYKFHLFYGCKDLGDEIKLKQLNQYKKQGLLENLYISYSKQDKTHVQIDFQNYLAKIILNEQFHIFICGFQVFGQEIQKIIQQFKTQSFDVDQNVHSELWG